MRTCPCCGYRAFHSAATCAVCYWIDDLEQLANAWLSAGANRLSLAEAQAHFALLVVQHGLTRFFRYEHDAAWRPLRESDRALLLTGRGHLRLYWQT
jgi:Cysteine-rich CPCC